MHNKKEACRNFQRGSCQYGERCKFLHVIQQQPKSNAFGFGTQAISHQQQKPNPFGFGVQNNAQSKGANDFGNKQSQFKNTWTRSSASSGAPSLRQPDNQPQATNHRCNDPESCKRIIAEDFEHERPLWKLTCYSHWKNSPCDIVGDVSYEELRAAAYDDAKRGLSLQSIVRRSSIPYFPDLQLHIERERNLLNSKLVEFENFLRNPYRGPAGSAAAQQIPFPGATTTVLSPTTQNTVAPQSNVPPSVSSFSQLGASLNTGFSPGPSVQSNNASGQPTSFSNSAQSSNQPNQSVAASFPTNMANFSNSSAINPAINQFSAAAVSMQNFSSSSIQSSAFLNVSLSNSEVVGREATNVQLGNNLPTTVASGDSNIWLKEKWTPGEIELELLDRLLERKT
ncbi:zinc finger CCCH domain-containing protein 16 isoform X1 [Gossypium australe]|uniref:Zinc finger CCCH domain-containing protein 16 isoform X1 n=1 Tax=Gossypium australe TaxID=47621 RepID=A0A5B6V644_9ROSI|nr:zinc finger CCCH domain-containing protein 16 isoform X1 [Gossypium australe]